MIDLNGAAEQKEFSQGPIPPNSIVWVKMEIRKSTDKKSKLNDLLTVSENNNHYLDCELEVLSPSYSGSRIWERYIVSGHEKATQISMSIIRAMVEASRKISPKDTSPAASKARQLNDWADLQGIQFPVQVGIQKSRQGDKYINNSIKKVITLDNDKYQESLIKGEIITDEIIPDITVSASAPATNKSLTADWSGPPKDTTPPPPATDSNIPPWAR